MIPHQLSGQVQWTQCVCVYVSFCRVYETNVYLRNDPARGQTLNHYCCSSLVSR